MVAYLFSCVYLADYYSLVNTSTKYYVPSFEAKRSLTDCSRNVPVHCKSSTRNEHEGDAMPCNESVRDTPYRAENRMQYSVPNNSRPVLRLIDHLRVWLGHDKISSATYECILVLVLCTYIVVVVHSKYRAGTEFPGSPMARGVGICCSVLCIVQ